MNSSLLPVSVCILAHNEEQNLPDCLDSVVSKAGQVVVLNAGSTDQTTAIIDRYREQHPQVERVDAENDIKYNVNKMKSFAAATQEWIFYLDADERFTPALWKELSQAIQLPQYNGFRVGRKNFYFGHWMRFGGMYPEKQPRLFRRGKGSFTLEHVHAQLDVQGEVGELKEPFLHYSYSTVSQFLRKLDTYTTFQAELWWKQGVRWSWSNHWKYGVVRPLARFLQKYLLLQGFRDGFLGFFSASMSAVSEFVAYTKVKDQHVRDLSY